MDCKVVRSVGSDRDLSLIFDHLMQSYLSFGEEREEAFARAVARLESLEDQLGGLSDRPHKGTLIPDVMPGLRRLTRNQIVIYFLVDDAAREIRILAFFFSGQDHQRRMLARLLADKEN